MPASCPQCRQRVVRGADGAYPDRCSACGVRFRSNASTAKKASPAPPTSPAAVDSTAAEQLASSPISTQAAKAPGTAVGGERVIRSFTARRQTPHESPPGQQSLQTAFPLPALAEEPVNHLLDKSPADHSIDNPFDDEPLMSMRLEPALDSDAIAPFTLAPLPPPLQTSAAAVLVENPFESRTAAQENRPLIEPRKKAVAASSIVKWTVMAVLGCGVVSVSGYVLYRQQFSEKAKTERSGFHNPDRNYIFYGLDGSWKEDKGRAARGGYDLAFSRADLNAFVLIRTLAPSSETESDGREAAEEAAKLWPERLEGFSAGPMAKGKLAGLESWIVKGEGTLAGVKTFGSTYVVVREGVVYHLGFEAPTEYLSLLEGDFAKARKNFEFTGSRTDGAKEIGQEATTVFASKKFPYRMSAPAKQWRESPELQTDSRFDDLKLVDRARIAEVTVAPRETKDLPGMRVRYVDAQKRRYDSKVRELDHSIEKISINGRPAMRTILIVTTQDGDFVMYATFIQGDGLVFQVQGRAPVGKRDVYEPMFAKLTDSFEVLDKVQAPTLEAKKATLPKDESADAPKMPEMKPAEAMKVPTKEKAKDESMPDAPANGMMEPEKKEPKTSPAEPKKKESEANVPKKDDMSKGKDVKTSAAEKKTEPTPKKRKSLDDLD